MSGKFKQVTGAAVLLGGALFGFASAASAHNKTYTATCQAGAVLSGDSYPAGASATLAFAGVNKTATFTNGAFSISIPNPDKTKPHEAVANIVSPDGQVQLTDAKIEVPACETPVTTTTTTTTIPATTQPPVTTIPATTQPATTLPATTVPTPSSTEPSAPSIPTTENTDCNTPPTPEQCLHPRHEVIATCTSFVTSGDGWSDQMHSVVVVGSETFTKDKYAWAVNRDSSVLGTSGYTYRVTATDARLPGSSYDSGLVSVPGCATAVVVGRTCAPGSVGAGETCGVCTPPRTVPGCAGKTVSAPVGVLPATGASPTLAVFGGIFLAVGGIIVIAAATSRKRVR